MKQAKIVKIRYEFLFQFIVVLQVYQIAVVLNVVTIISHIYVTGVYGLYRHP